MKARKYILGVALIGLIGSGCTNTWAWMPMVYKDVLAKRQHG